MKILLKRNNLIVANIPINVKCSVCESIIRIENINEVKLNAAADYPMIDCPVCKRFAPVEPLGLLDKFKTIFK